MDGGDGLGRNLGGSLGEEGSREPGVGRRGAHRGGCLDQTTQDSECGAGVRGHCRVRGTRYRLSGQNPHLKLLDSKVFC